MIEDQKPPTCPAMATLWQQAQENEELRALYHHSGFFRAAVHSDMTITQLVLLYEHERERLLARNVELSAKTPHVIPLEEVGHTLLEVKTRELQVVQAKLMTLTKQVIEYLNLPDKPQPEEVINYLHKAQAIKNNQD